MDGVSAESASLPGPQSLERFLVRGIASLRARKGYAAIMRVPPNAGEQRDDDCPGSDRNAGHAVARCREGPVPVPSLPTAQHRGRRAGYDDVGGAPGGDGEVITGRYQ